MSIKLRQILDKEIDQNEIESKYLWDFDSCYKQTLSRIDLLTLAIDFSQANPIEIKYSMNLPKNQMLGIYIQEDLQYLFIADENFNIKSIDIRSTFSYIKYHFTSCFYDDAIFIFESELDFSQGGIITQHAKKYIISQNKWVLLSDPPCNFPYSCTGISQKVIIAENGPYLWAYDIFLNSYTLILYKEFGKKAEQMLVKVSGKIYLIVFSYTNEIYCSEDPLSEWNILCNFEDYLFRKDAYHQAYFNCSIYFLWDQSIFKFSLKKYKSKKVKSKSKIIKL